MASWLRWDLVARLHEIYRNEAPDAGLPTLPFIPGKIPPDAVERLLEPLSVSFSELPRTLQYALLWDTSGIVIGSDGMIVELRTYCGLFGAVALDWSTIALPTCAIMSIPTSRPGEDDGSTIWLEFSSKSPLPKRLALHSEPTEGAAVTSCSTSPQVFQSFCVPQSTPLLVEWLGEFASFQRRQRYLDQLATAAHSLIPDGKKRLETGPSESTGTLPNSHFDQQVAVSRGLIAQANQTKGLWSDFSSLYYVLHGKGHVVPHIALSSSVPADVQARLDTSQLTFTGLKGLLQRALLWDSGYVLVKHTDSSTKVDAVPVYVKCGLTMADIALDRGYFEATGCGVQDCSWLNESSGETTYSFRSRECSNSSSTSAGEIDLSSLIRCAIPSTIEDSGVSVPFTTVSTVWAVGNLSTTNHSDIPHIWLQRYPSVMPQYVIHSVSVDVDQDVCPSSPSFIIPCLAIDHLSLRKEWCRPIQSESMTAWLRQEERQEMSLATLILLAGAILLALALDLFADRKPRFFANGRVSVSIPSLTSTILEPVGDQSQTDQSGDTDQSGESSLRSARTVE